MTDTERSAYTPKRVAALVDLHKSAKRPVITPRPGESETAAIIRTLDPHAGSGLTQADVQAMALADRDEAARFVAELRDALAERDELIARLLHNNSYYQRTVTAQQARIAELERDYACACLSARTVTP